MIWYMADPDDPGFGDQDRYVGDGAGMHRAEVRSPGALAVALLVAVLVVIAGLFGLILGLVVVYAFGWPSLAGLVGALAGAIGVGALCAIVLRRRAIGPPWIRGDR